MFFCEGNLLDDEGVVFDDGRAALQKHNTSLHSDEKDAAASF